MASQLFVFGRVGVVAVGVLFTNSPIELLDRVLDLVSFSSLSAYGLLFGLATARGEGFVPSCPAALPLPILVISFNAFAAQCERPSMPGVSRPLSLRYCFGAYLRRKPCTYMGIRSLVRVATLAYPLGDVS